MNAAKAQIKWNEKALQDAVYIHCGIKNHEVIVPNSCVFGWESDVISVTQSGFIHEFEIKVTRADFKQDLKKHRAKVLINPVEVTTWHTYNYKRPNYFYYVVPDGLITADEVPEYAGLIYVMKFVKSAALYYGTTNVIKEAPRIHKEKISEKQSRQLSRAITYRFWKQRLNKPTLVFEQSYE